MAWWNSTFRKARNVGHPAQRRGQECPPHTGWCEFLSGPTICVPGSLEPAYLYFLVLESLMRLRSLLVRSIIFGVVLASAVSAVAQYTDLAAVNELGGPAEFAR